MVQKESETHLRFGRKLKSKLSNLKKIHPIHPSTVGQAASYALTPVHLSDLHPSPGRVRRDSFSGFHPLTSILICTNIKH
jgi:hypothetical protein